MKRNYFSGGAFIPLDNSYASESIEKMNILHISESLRLLLDTINQVVVCIKNSLSPSVCALRKSRGGGYPSPKKLFALVTVHSSLLTLLVFNFVFNRMILSW